MNKIMKISHSRWEKTPEKKKKISQDRNYIWLDTENNWEEVELRKFETSPSYGELTIKSPWEGSCDKKPWEYKATAVIPCLNTSETLRTCIELLRLQTERPYIMIIDTGSRSDHLDSVLYLRDEDVEVHTIALNGVMHPSDYPAMAMDLAMTLCRTPYLFATHADVFLKRNDFIDYLLNICNEKTPVVGYEITPRKHDDWRGMISHTASMYHMKTMDKIGFAWSLRRLCNEYNIVDYKPDPMRPNWPDTEILGNYILRKNNIETIIIGHEENEKRTNDSNIDHFRSYTSGKMYSPPHFKKTKEWFEDAMKLAKIRIKEWSNCG